MTTSINAIKKFPVYPIGTPGQKWGDAEKAQWLGAQKKVRDYFSFVLTDFLRIDCLDFFQYGSIDYRNRAADNGTSPGAVYPLFAGRSRSWDAAKPLVLVTSFVHGYEPTTKAINLFCKKYMAEFQDRANFLFLPAVSPWGVEYDQRWNPDAIDPNRQFDPTNPGCEEARLAMQCVFDQEKLCAGILAAFDLHETPDRDNTVMEPMKYARDGLVDQPWQDIPPGFYLVAGDYNDQPAFQKAMIDAVRKVTAISPPDEKGEIIGSKVTQEGVITITARKWHICGGFTNAPYSTTTEVYPDLEGVTTDICNEAQATCIAAGCRYALANPLPPLKSE